MLKGSLAQKSSKKQMYLSKTSQHNVDSWEV